MTGFGLVISLASIGISIASIVRTERDIRRLKRREQREAELAVIRQIESMLRNDMPLGKLWPASKYEMDGPGWNQDNKRNQQPL